MLRGDGPLRMGGGCRRKIGHGPVRGQGRRTRRRCRGHRGPNPGEPVCLRAAAPLAGSLMPVQFEEQVVAREQPLPVVMGRAGRLSGRDATPVACVDEQACTPCGACQAVCPTEAIRLGEGTVRVNADACCGCGACMEVCPNGAIRLS